MDVFVRTVESLNCMWGQTNPEKRTYAIWKCLGALSYVIIITIYKVYATVNISADLHQPTRWGSLGRLIGNIEPIRVGLDSHGVILNIRWIENQYFFWVVLGLWQFWFKKKIPSQIPCLLHGNHSKLEFHVFLFALEYQLLLSINSSAKRD